MSEYVISRLEKAIERQENEEGEIATNPTVVYCFECDEITVDSWTADCPVEHDKVRSDGYEHAGIGAAITALEATH